MQGHVLVHIDWCDYRYCKLQFRKAQPCMKHSPVWSTALKNMFRNTKISIINTGILRGYTAAFPDNKVWTTNHSIPTIRQGRPLSSCLCPRGSGPRAKITWPYLYKRWIRGLDSDSPAAAASGWYSTSIVQSAATVTASQDFETLAAAEEDAWDRNNINKWIGVLELPVIYNIIWKYHYQYR